MVEAATRFRVTFGDGSSLYVQADSHAAARMRACLTAWLACSYWPTVSAVERIEG